MQIEFIEKDGLDSYYIIVDNNGNFFAKTYRNFDAKRIAKLHDYEKALERALTNLNPNNETYKVIKNILNS